MAWSLVNVTKVRLGYATFSVTIPATTVGNTLLFIGETSPIPDAGWVPSQLSISGGGTWVIGSTTCTDAANESDSSNPAIAFYAVCAACSTSTTSITFTVPAGTSWNVTGGWLFEISGADASSPVNTAVASSSSASATGSPSVAGCAAFVVGGSHNTPGIWPSGYTDLGTNNLYWYLNGSYNLSAPSGSQTVSNTAALADNLLVVWLSPASGGTVYNVSISEAADLADSPSSAANFAVALAEAMSLADSLSATGQFAAALAEAMSLADAASTGGSPISVVIAEAMTLADTPSSLANFAAAIAEAMSLADTQGVSGTINVAIAEAISLVDDVSVRAQFAAALAEAMSLGDTVNIPVIVTAAIIEALSLVDAVTITTPTVPKPQLTPPALLMADAKEHRRQIAQAIQFLYQGKGPTPIDGFTLNANATSTTLIDARIGFYSHVTFMPQTANAAAVAASLWTPQSQQIGGQLVVEHESTVNTDCVFRVIIWG